MGEKELEKKETFHFTYSAKEQAEVNRIREKYLPKEESGLEQLRRLDSLVTRRGTILSIIVGTLGTLILGLGMSCVTVWEDYFVLGILIGIIGLVGICLAYPLYQIITRKERERLAPQILALSEDLLKQSQ